MRNDHNPHNTKSNTGKHPLFGTPTPAKASGIAFTAAVLLPSVLGFVFLIVIGICGLGKDGYEKTDWYAYVNYLLPQISFAIVAAAYLLYTKTPFKIAAQKQKCKPKYFLIALLLQIGLLSLSQVNTWFVAFLERLGYPQSPLIVPSLQGWKFALAVLVIAVFPAIFEEVFFRGVLLNGLGSFTKVGAVLVCGGLFSLYHQNPAQTIYQFCCGASFALVALQAGSILPTVLSHFLNNFLVLTLEKYGFATFSTPVTVSVMIVSSLCLVGTLVYLLVFDKQSVTKDGGASGDKEEKKRFFYGVSVGAIVCAIVWVFNLFSVGK